VAGIAEPAAAGTTASSPADGSCLLQAATSADARAAYTCLHPEGPATRSSAATDPLPLPNSSSGCDVPGVDDRCEQWTQSYQDPAAGDTSSQFPSDIALSPDGKVTYMSVNDKHGQGFDTRSQIVVLAYNAATGAKLWEAKWGDFDRYSYSNSVTTSPDGSLVFVTGNTRSEYIDPDGHLTTLAFDARTGDLVWNATYDTPGGSWDNGVDVAVDPSGSGLYVSAVSTSPTGTDLDYLFLGYDAATGAQRWATRWNGIGQGKDDSPFSMVLSPDGHYMYATGWSDGEGDYNVDYGTVALATDGPDAGRILWEQRYDGPAGVHAPDEAFAIAVSPLGDKVFATGLSDDVASGPPFNVNYAFATVAYDAATGQALWTARKQWDGTTFNAPEAIAASPDGAHVYVTGQTSSATSTKDLDFGTVAYASDTGAEAWSDRYGLPDHTLELGKTISVTPGADKVYVSGVSSDSRTSVAFNNQSSSGDQLTIAYDGATGAKDWLARFNQTGYDFDVAGASVVSPDSSTLYTATTLTHSDSSLKNDVGVASDTWDAGAEAYPIGPPLPLPEAPGTSLSFAPGSSSSGQYSDAPAVSARLVNSTGRAVPNERVTFSLEGPNGTQSLGALTDAHGVATSPFHLMVVPGNYMLTARYTGRSGVYQGSGADTPFKVEKEAASLHLKRHAGRSLSARLADSDSGAAVSGARLVFFAGRHRLGARSTTTGGRATIRLPRRYRDAGRYAVRFSGAPYYHRTGATTR
jgi:hypothetical protein